MEYKGLSDQQVIANRKTFGTNEMGEKTKNPIWGILLEIIKEPLFVILLVASSIYFILGETTEGIIMFVAIGLVSGISIFQENKSRNAVNALKKLSSPQAKVYRNGEIIKIPTEEIVVKDLILVEDGNLIPADAKIVEAHDFSVNESILTGESLSLSKDRDSDPPIIFQGTLVDTGNCVAEVHAIGRNTKLGKIGTSLEEIEQTKTPLQTQIKSFVRYMVSFGAIAFLLVWGINYMISKDLLNALLQGLTLAMSILPEEIPVAFSTFMALGAYRLYKNKVITRSPYTVETLGAATIICTDKTGTLTENRMELRAIFDIEKGSLQDFTQDMPEFSQTLEYALWASEILPFDPMEKSIHEIYEKVAPSDERKSAKMLHEYPLGGKPPIMTHIFQKGNGEKVIAVKGAVEGVLDQSKLSGSEKKTVLENVEKFTQKGFRVLAVGKADPSINAFPKTQQEFEFEFLGLLAFYDPPKKNIEKVLNSFYKAGIEVKMITGDYPQTAAAIAEQVGLKSDGAILTGDEVMAMESSELQQKAKQTHVFARMFPEAKLKVVEALKQNGEVVAMTGDGVNDGPALKAAHIGIAMGKRGSEVAKSAAALVLVDDDLGHMTEAVALGRRIYENLKKAIQYIISIHIPIILIVLLPLVLGWEFTVIFTPIHVIFLELIMGPTCSIVFENEPIEPDSMNKPPRVMSQTFFSWSELSLSVVQGLAITGACLGFGYFLMNSGNSEATVRTLIFSTLVFSNIFLTLVNRSFYFSVVKTLTYENKLVPIVLGISLALLVLILTIPSFLKVFDFEAVSFNTLLYSLLISSLGVFWIEVWKFFKRKKVGKSLMMN
ncbi:cation-translocating P-type ATPase [Aquiflexum gelatinilyticum]|uniref:Cation-translocating P-type ATPase n=1 Tax=Aquiflexum gelatinilyticum TaxID=2961943 RepID=A0A9X2P1F8_9BACT|nr:cation-translocating P-type ATPase [Aquiflexum gelatinilyticum]MCR9013436.1 cation-translocating P-type ATPase [Aquiflexum gelatinilyticum]